MIRCSRLVCIMVVFTLRAEDCYGKTEPGSVYNCAEGATFSFGRLSQDDFWKSQIRLAVVINVKI